jgi:hypothetical protein
MLNIPPDVERDAMFVKVYLQTGDGLDACKRAGFIINGYDDRTVAEYLLDRCDIQEAIKIAKESKGKKPASVDITRESIISDLDAIHQSAMIDKDYTPAIAAKKLQAQLMGVLQETVQVTHKMDVTRMTDDQLMKLIALKSKQEDLNMIDITPTGLSQISGPARTNG